MLNNTQRGRRRAGDDGGQARLSSRGPFPADGRGAAGGRLAVVADRAAAAGGAAAGGRRATTVGDITSAIA